MPSPAPAGDPKAARPPWAPYPDPLPAWKRLGARLLSPPGSSPAESWWALDGQAVPGPVFLVLAMLGEPTRSALFGPVERVGLHHFDVGDRIIVQCQRFCFVLLPEAPMGWQVQSVYPDALVDAIRALPSLPPAPGAPPVK